MDMVRARRRRRNDMDVQCRRLPRDGCIREHNFILRKVDKLEAFCYWYSRMSPVLPFDIIALIIDIVGEENDTNLLKELALVSHSFLQICSKHLFATIELHDIGPDYDVGSSKKGFVKLLKSRPDVVKYIRKLTYYVGYNLQPCFNISNDHRLFSSVLPNLLRTIPHLKCLTITTSHFNCWWNTLDSSLTSAFLYLMHLPTINHIDLSLIQNFPLSSFTPSVNLHRLDLLHLTHFDDEDDSLEIVVQSEMMPKIREFRTSGSALLTTKLLHAKKQDGQPAFNFMDLKRLTTYLHSEDEWNLQYLLQNAKLLESLHLSGIGGQSLTRLHDILSPSARTIKVLDLTVSIYHRDPLPLAGLCEGLEAMAGHYILEDLSLEVPVDDHETVDSIGLDVERLDKVLIEPGWSALRQVSIKVKISCSGNGSKLYDALQSLPDKYLSHLSNLESVAFNFSAYVVKGRPAPTSRSTLLL